MRERARLGVDNGATSTDAALESPAGRFTAEVPTTHAAPDDGVLARTKRVLAAAGLQTSDLDAVIHGTILATNLLIERKGARTGMLTTAGHRDVLSIGLDHRFDLYDLGINLPEPLVPRALRLPVAERLASDGRVLVHALFDRVAHPARGREGGMQGADGSCGLASGLPVRAKGQQDLPAGGRLVLELPGGGGFGSPSERTSAALERDRADGLEPQA